MAIDNQGIERLLSRPNRLIAAALLVLCAVAWLQLYGWGPAAQHVHLHRAHPWSPQQAALILCMWLLMAVAMMLPTAAPAILAFADIARAGREGVPAATRVTGFVGGYLIAWWAFGVAATAAQWMLASVAQRIPLLAAGHPLMGAAALMGAGLYQFSTIKDHCLTQCRSPMTFFLAHWRDGVRGALALGWRHGMHCVGCCWALMALMLAAGSMNIAWTAALAVVMLAEKVLPAGRRLARVVGVALMCGAVALIAAWQPVSGAATAGDAAGPIRIFAAASLVDVLQEVGNAYTNATGTKVEFSFASSSTLARQLENGAQADVYCSADEVWMDYLQQRRLIQPATRRDLAGNRLALVAPADRSVQLRIQPGFPLLAALRDGRLATGDPDSVPVGRYARAALTNLGVWHEVEERLALADDARKALMFVASGEAPLGIVYETDARAEKRVRIVGLFPPDSHPPITYPVALTSMAQVRSADFVAFLRGPVGTAALRKYGFSVPGSTVAD